MVRSYRIKEVRFSQEISAATTGSFVSDETINGEILEVNWAFNRTGSVFLTEGETTQEVFRRNAPSGTGTQFGYPARFTEATTGSIANAQHEPFVVHAPLVLNVTGLASGTQTLDVNVKYR